MHHLYSYDVFFLLDISVIKLSYLCSAQRTWRGFFGDGWNKPLPNWKHIARTLGSFHVYPDIFKSANFSLRIRKFPVHTYRDSLSVRQLLYIKRSSADARICSPFSAFNNCFADEITPTEHKFARLTCVLRLPICSFDMEWSLRMACRRLA